MLQVLRFSKTLSFYTSNWEGMVSGLLNLKPVKNSDILHLQGELGLRWEKIEYNLLNTLMIDKLFDDIHLTKIMSINKLLLASCSLRINHSIRYKSITETAASWLHEYLVERTMGKF